MRSFSSVLAREFDLEGLADSALQDLVRHVDASAGAVLVVRDDRLEVLASHGLRGAEGLAENGHVRRVLCLGVTERLRVAPAELVVDSLIVGQSVHEIVVTPVTFKGTPSGRSSWPPSWASRPTRSRCSTTSARTCRRVVREGDVLVRYGGEESLVVLPGAGSSDIQHMGERIRHAVADTPVVDGDQRLAVTVTVSVGSSTYDQGVDSVDGLIAAADRALYEAKEGGRDRVVLA